MALIGIGTSGCDAWRVFFPSSHHDDVSPVLPASLARPAVLVFSKTNGFRHGEAIAAGAARFATIADERGWGFFATENGAVHAREALARFDAIVWLNVSGDVLAEDQRAALLEWIEAGGAFFGIHGTGGDPSYDWADHPDRLVGARFVGHPMGPQFQEATVVVEAPAHPVVRHLPEEWVRTDEWYSFERSPRGPGVEVLARLDESSYSPRLRIAFYERDLAMGEDHPIVWTHCLGRGRVLYSALGHRAEAYAAEPAHEQMLEAGLDWLVEASRGPGCRIAAAE